jgi:hypothetical protein
MLLLKKSPILYKSASLPLAPPSVALEMVVMTAIDRVIWARWYLASFFVGICHPSSGDSVELPEARILSQSCPELKAICERVQFTAFTSAGRNLFAKVCEQVHARLST